jgi:hypothetical protein
VDNNPARVAAARYFRSRSVAIIFVAVSADADHAYVFLQDRSGPCIGCLFPDMGNDEAYPCPGTPAISDILQLIGAMATYAVDTTLVNRKRDWNYRAIYLSTTKYDCASYIQQRANCQICGFRR